MKTKLDKEDLSSFAAMIWAAWSYRNAVVHDAPWKDRDLGILDFLRLVGEYKGYAQAVFMRNRPGDGLNS